MATSLIFLQDISITLETRIDNIVRQMQYIFKKLKNVKLESEPDEVTQYELIATVEKITERYLKPTVEELLK